MFKKILLALFIIFIALCINVILTFNSEIVINYLDFQVNTTTGFLIFLLTALVVAIYLVFYIFTSLFNLHIFSKYQKQTDKKFKKYLKYITETLIYKKINNLDKAFTKLREANKYYSNADLSNLIESQLYFMKKNYVKSEEIFNKIKNNDLNLNLLHLEINLAETLQSNQEDKMLEYAEEIIKIEPVNANALNILLKLYIKNRKWLEAYTILERGLKAKVFNKHHYKDQILFISATVAQYYYDKKEYDKAKDILKPAYKLDSSYLPTALLLINIYNILGRNAKALRLIKKTWKQNTNKDLAELYFSLFTQKERDSIDVVMKLYKLNPKSYYSNYLLAKAYYNEEIYSKAREYAKNAESIAETKSLYQLMLDIEIKDSGSSALINNLKNKILNSCDYSWECKICKTEYANWQVECHNCHNINTIYYLHNN